MAESPSDDPSRQRHQDPELMEGGGTGVAVDSEQLAGCHAVGNYLLRTFADVCEAEGVGYFLDTGTLLGAVRHSGWIPWDDDVDVCMLRDEYERLAMLPAGAFPDDLRLSVPGRDKGHVTSVARLNYLASALTWVERLGVAPPERQRIVLDIYVVDRAPARPLVPAWLAATRILQILAAAHGTNLRKLWSSTGSSPLRAVGFLVVGASRLVPLRTLHRMNRRVSMCAKRDRGQSYVLNHPRWMRGTPLASEWFRTGGFAPFEGRSFPVPRWAPVLTSLYGSDFMTPPPEADRRGHVLRGVLG